MKFLIKLTIFALVAEIISAHNYIKNQENLRRPRDVNITVTLDDFNVYFHSPSNPTKGRHLTPHTFDGFVGEGFDPLKKSIICAHGWVGRNTSDSCPEVRRAVLQNGGANMFIIDYRRIAHEFYSVAVMSLPKLGIICGDFIDKLLNYYNLDSKQIMLTGHSLGGQLVAYCASNMRQKPGEILGLDPAQPLFSSEDPDNCLGKEDADVVHVIHTNKGLLGFETSIGHADFYANGGGMNQPGCGPDLFGTCAHSRAVDYFSESIINAIAFKSHQCNSYEDYQKGLCENNEVSYFGGINLNVNVRGDYYFNTNDVSPFGLNER